jgi:hypothetical protein
MKRRPYPVGPIDPSIDDQTVAITIGNYEFTIGSLRHAGLTEQAIASVIREGKT